MRAGVHILGILPVALIAVGCGAASSPAPATDAGALEPAATAQAVAQRAPELIPLNHFFASREPTWRHQPSPDGTRLAWLGSHGSRTTVLFRAFGGETVRTIDTHSRRSIGWFIWARDSRRILYAQDQDGDENYHVYLASTERPDDKPVDLTQDPGSRAGISRIPRSDPKHIVVTWNKRDRSVFDLYRVNLDTHDHVLIAENPGDVIEWHTDWNGQPRARIRAVGSSERRLEVLREGRWVEMLRLDLEEFDLRVLGVTADDRALWLLSSHRRDRRALVRLDLATAAETLVYEHASLDVEWVDMSERSRAPLAVFTTPDARPSTSSTPISAATSPASRAGTRRPGSTSAASTTRSGSSRCRSSTRRATRRGSSIAARASAPSWPARIWRRSPPLLPRPSR